VDKLKEYCRSDRFARHVGIELVDVSKGRATARLVLGDCHANAAELVHGGAMFTLAACAFFAAANSHGSLALGVNASINFVRAVRGGTLTAEAVEDSVNPRLGSYSVTVRNEDGQTVATFQGLAYRKPSRRS